MNNSISIDVKKITDKYGNVKMYDPKTNTFASYNPDGSTKTFFKPPKGKGMSYWKRQLEKNE